MDIFTDEMRCNFRIDVHTSNAPLPPQAPIVHSEFNLNAKIKLSFLHTFILLILMLHIF